jgi:hypothetical protein
MYHRNRWSFVGEARYVASINGAADLALPLFHGGARRSKVRAGAVTARNSGPASRRRLSLDRIGGASRTVKALRTVFPRLDIVVEEMEPSDGLGALGSWRTDVALIDDISTAAAPIVPLGSRPRVARTALRSSVCRF